ncbi:MAG TPA: tetratricopeptide repeat protein [Candidatus Polarisedimenticolaceae bacterium]
MLVHSAENRFQRGMEALNRGRGLEGLALFEAAIELERQHGAPRPQARYLSWYGLALALEGGRVREGVEFCRQAVPLEFYNPELYLNLGRVLIVAGRKREAYDALRKGIALQPSHPGIQRELARLGRRRRPVVPFLDRSHPINVALGKMFRPVKPKQAPAEAPAG